MTLRYTCPMIPLMFLDWRYFLVGNAAAPIYLFAGIYTILTYGLKNCRLGLIRRQNGPKLFMAALFMPRVMLSEA